MKSSKLITVLSSFSDKEFRDLIEFLQYRSLNNANYLQFIQVLSDAYPNFEESDISKDKVFQLLYPKAEYEDVKVRELMSVVFKQVSEFIVFSEVNNDDFHKDLALLRQYRKRKYENLFNQQLKSVKRSLSKDKLRNIEFTRREFLIAEEENQFFEDQQIRAFDESIQTKLDSLDIYYFSIKLRDTCEMLNRQKILNQKYRLNLIEEMDQVIEKYKDDYLNYPSLNCYFEIYQLLASDDNEHQLSVTIETLKQNVDYFSKREIKSMFDFALNYCIRQVNKGNQIYISKLFELQKYLIENEIMLDKGELSHISFRNIVSIALKLKEYDWSEDFIETYRETITPKYRENAYNLNKAYLFNATKSYDDTIGLLNEVDFTDVYYACSAKFTLLKAYYELKEYETLEYFTTAFNLYLKRNKEISPAYKKSSQNFIRTFKKILNIAAKLDYLEEDKIKHKISLINKLLAEEKDMANRSWLKEKTEELHHEK